MNLILASASERRIELLKRISKEFKVIVSDFDEKSIIYNGNISDYVITLAIGKAEAVARRVENIEPADTLIIGCDTVVYFKDKILEKPLNESEAYKMLEMLSGETHKVFSGIAVYDLKAKAIKTDFAVTDVKFSILSDKMIRKYVEIGDCMDKAGAYGIQGDAAVFVEGISGCFYNVVGLPLNKLYKMLKEMGVNL